MTDERRETFREQVERVIQMSRDSGETWDLSPNDQAALKSVLLRLALLDSAAEAVRELPRSLTWRIAEAFQEFRGPDADAEWVRWSDVQVALGLTAPDAPEGQGK